MSSYNSPLSDRLGPPESLDVLTLIVLCLRNSSHFSCKARGEEVGGSKESENSGRYSSHSVAVQVQIFSFLQMSPDTIGSIFRGPFETYDFLLILFKIVLKS